MTVESQKKNEAESHEAKPSSGVTMPARKKNPKGVGEPHDYRFSTDNEVRDAEVVPNAAAKAADAQIGLNRSRLNKDTAPGGDLKDGEPETYDTGLIGTP